MNLKKILIILFLTSITSINATSLTGFFNCGSIGGSINTNDQWLFNASLLSYNILDQDSLAGLKFEILSISGDNEFEITALSSKLYITPTLFKSFLYNEHMILGPFIDFGVEVYNEPKFNAHAGLKFTFNEEAMFFDFDNPFPTIIRTDYLDIETGYSFYDRNVFLSIKTDLLIFLYIVGTAYVEMNR